MAVNAQPIPIPFKQSAHFTTEQITFESTWTIQNFVRLCDAQIEFTPLLSPTFIAPPDKITTEDKKPVEFEIVLYPNGNNFENREFVGVFLELKDRPGLNIMYSLSVVMVNGEKRRLAGGIKKFDPATDMSWGVYRGIRRDELLNSANGFLSDGSLTLHCDLNIIMTEPAKPDLVELCDQLQDKYCPPEQLTKSMADLLDSGAYADVTFIMVNDAGQELRAHKNILATRSRVFADMFESRMAESVTNRVEIVESREVFKQALHFIYTGKVGTELDAIAKDLLICADKYQLDPLKLICEDHLSANINSESNLSKLLELANRHNAPKLKAKVLDSIRKKFEVQIEDLDKVMQLDRFMSNLAIEPID